MHTPQSQLTILIASVMREQGETGIQSYFNTLQHALVQQEVTVAIVTPFHHWLVMPVFGLRKLIDPLSGALSVWWYRHWHYVFLKQALQQRLKTFAQQQQPVVVYVQDPLAAKAALEARQDSTQTVVAIAHFNRSEADEWVGKGKINQRSWIYRQIKQLERTVLPLVDGIVYTTTCMKEILEASMPELSQLHSAVLPCFVTQTAITNPVECSGNLINIGTLEARKNQSYLLQVLAEARKRGKEYSLTLLGQGADSEKLKALSCDLGIERQVNFVGFQKNVAAFLSRHQVYIHSALFESFGMVLIEAMSQGLPLLAGAVGGIPEVFSNGVEGFYWSLENPTADAEKLILLMEDSDLRNQMAKAAKERFSNKFESGAVTVQLLQFFHDVATGK